MEEDTKIEKARDELPNRNLDRVIDAFTYVTLIVTVVAFWGYKFEQGDYPVFWSLFSFSFVLLVVLVRPSSLLDRHVHSQSWNKQYCVRALVFQRFPAWISAERVSSNSPSEGVRQIMWFRE
jgi:hypothetical protein